MKKLLTSQIAKDPLDTLQRHEYIYLLSVEHGEDPQVLDQLSTNGLRMLLESKPSNSKVELRMEKFQEFVKSKRA